MVNRASDSHMLQPAHGSGHAKALYVLALTARKLAPAELQAVVHIADEMLTEKSARFAEIMSGEMRPDSRIEIANIVYAGPVIHTPHAMQSSMSGWLNKRYGVLFHPVVGHTFFPHGMRDPQGRENYFLFYFDMES